MPPLPPPDPEFEELICYVQVSRGIDFRGYKRTSLQRRIALRMCAVAAASYADYQSYLEVHPDEFMELLNTVLINVTSFFRDADAWDMLRSEIVQPLCAPERGDQPIRIWSVGCASGEEPYSLAMMFAEILGVAEFCRRVKIYATDLDEAALHAARHATYASRDVESVPRELLEKYFERANNHYVFQRELRKCVIFGRHNVVHDAPISRIDLLVCRNLLIYLETDTQEIVLPRLHYALEDDGYLFLGKAETQLARSKLFRPLDMKHRLFTKVAQEWRRSPGGSIGLGKSNGANLQLSLLEAVVDNGAAGYLAVDQMGNLIFANYAARRMFEIGEADLGRPFQDLPISYRPAELRSRIEQALREGHPVRIEHQEYHRPPAEPIRLTIEVTPLGREGGGYYATLLSFTDTTRSFRLQQDLDAAQESLETTIEELQSANEELETTNEELQSTNEELETMNEELRSTNEEFHSANEELRRQSDESVEYRTHAEAVLSSIDAGIVVLDPALRVLSWNRWSENAWGLRAEEVIGQDLLGLDFGLPVRLLRAALATIIEGRESHADMPLEAYDRRGRNMQCRVRLSPLIERDKNAHGIVLIVEDVTEERQHEDYTRHLGRVIGESSNEVYFLDPKNLHFTLVNRGAEQKLGYSISQLRHIALSDLMPQISAEALRSLIAPLLADREKEVVFETVMQASSGATHPVEICLQYFADEQPPILVAMVHETSERVSLGANADAQLPPRA